uniref:Uncharacterized protein n=1 Tax=Plectus sambesii TaxID=2011161 RepID=A0A914WDT7_9BILA
MFAHAWLPRPARWPASLPGSLRVTNDLMYERARKFVFATVDCGRPECADAPQLKRRAKKISALQWCYGRPRRRRRAVKSNRREAACCACVCVCVSASWAGIDFCAEPGGLLVGLELTVNARVRVCRVARSPVKRDQNRSQASTSATTSATRGSARSRASEPLRARAHFIVVPADIAISR